MLLQAGYRSSLGSTCLQGQNIVPQDTKLGYSMRLYDVLLYPGSLTFCRNTTLLRRSSMLTDLFNLIPFPFQLWTLYSTQSASWDLFELSSMKAPSMSKVASIFHNILSCGWLCVWWNGPRYYYNWCSFFLFLFFSGRESNRNVS